LTVKTRFSLLVAIVTLSLTVSSYAAEELAASQEVTMSQAESQSLISTLSGTSASSRTWISAGTIVATHEEYRAARTTDEAEINAEIQRQIEAYEANPNKTEVTAEAQDMALQAIPFNVRYKLSNEYKMTSKVTVKYDGDKFSWAIDVISRSDTVSLPGDLKDNHLVRYFNMDWNANRIFTWDGQKYTMQMASGKYAEIDAAGNVAHKVNGPLTAGVIPWGSGIFAASNLNTSTTSAVKASRDGRTQIDMTLQAKDGSTLTFTFDPALDNAVTSYTWRGSLKAIRSNNYSGHKKVGDKWIPWTILVEERDAETDRLLKSDKWDITSIDLKTPRSFNTAMTTGTQVEYFSPVSLASSVYTYSNMVDTDALLADQIAFNVARERAPQNCATAALKYLASRFGKTASDKDLTRLVESNGKTSLETVAQAARGMGMYARVVKTDLASLRTLTNCKAVLHFPRNEHFVVVDSVEGSDVWLVDLSANKFFFRMSADRLALEWSKGTALLISSQPIKGAFADIDSTRLAADIWGGDSGRSCTLVKQYRGAIYCSDGGSNYGCDGCFQWFFFRRGCEDAASGTCSENTLYCYGQWTPCVPDLGDPLDCDGNGDWVYDYNLACG
jgi:hypothetical protein